MTAQVKVISDPDDDVKTVHGLYSLARSEPGVLVVAIAPEPRQTSAVVWAILRALGKRLEHLRGTAPDWYDATSWLAAHGITEMIVIRAQHLRDEDRAALIGNVAEQAGIRVTLVINGEELSVGSKLDRLVGRRRSRSPARAGADPDWPQIPRCHPLLLRFECARAMPEKDFDRVDAVLLGAMEALLGWLSSSGDTPSTTDLATALALVCYGASPAHAYIRRSAVVLAFLVTGREVSALPAAAFEARPISDDAMRQILAHTDPAIGGYLLAKHLTGLAGHHLELIGGDQITESSILGCEVPIAARPVLSMLSRRRSGTAAFKPPHGAPLSRPSRPAHPGSRPLLTSTEFTRILSNLLAGRRRIISTSVDLAPDTRRRLERLRARGLLDENRGRYQASDIALYGTYGPKPYPYTYSPRTGSVFIPQPLTSGRTNY